MHTPRPLTIALLAVVPLAIGLAGCTASPAARIATDTEPVTHAENARVPDGAAWTQHYFPSSDGSDVELHADVLLPEDLPDGEEVPVILSVGAYFGHGGELTPEDHDHAGPSDRFQDLIEGIDLFDSGYAFVMVDLRGFGGSTGCLDFMGPGEQADVAAAIDWAAGQPWSTGDVAMYGKSYDAMTGLVGNNLGPDALKAVVAQEPFWDLGSSARSNGVARTGIVDTSRSYNEAAVIPPMPDDDERYRANAEYEKTNPTCTVLNSQSYRISDQESEYWTARDLATLAEGSDTPLLITQGFLEPTTPPEDFQRFMDNHEGPLRGWFGQWDHIRGNDTDADGNPRTGRDGWFDEVAAFFDEHLRGAEPDTELPAFAVQDSEGAWRAEETWPSVDGEARLDLPGGSYVDDSGEGDPTTTVNRFAHFSEPVAEDVRVTGTPSVSLEATGHGNVMVRLHDVAPDGTSVLFDEHVSVLRPGTTAFELKSTDWMLAAGHSLAMEVGTIQPAIYGNWIPTASLETIDVSSITLDLAFDDPANDARLPGEPAAFLAVYRASSAIPVAPAAPSFVLPVP
jgi:uncharacterized protein